MVLALLKPEPMTTPVNRAMTALKPIAVLALALMLASVAFAQLPAANPLVVPPLPPGPPAQLPAPVSTAIAPIPISVPSLPAAYSTPGARMFNCSCSGPGQPTHWMGQVTAAGYLSASQSASGACVSYNQRKGSVLRSGGRHWCRQFFRAAAWGAAERGRRQVLRLSRSGGEFGIVQFAWLICGGGARCGRSQFVRRARGRPELFQRTAATAVFELRM